MFTGADEASNTCALLTLPRGLLKFLLFLSFCRLTSILLAASMFFQWIGGEIWRMGHSLN